MKNLRFLLIGLLCFGAIGLASLAKPVKADGIKPIDPSETPGSTKGVPCNCTCTYLTIDSATYTAPNIGASVAYGTNPDCLVKLVLVAAPMYYDGVNTWTDPQQSIDTEDTGASGTTTMTGTAPAAGVNCVGWTIQVYMIRKCDNTIIGWSNEVNVSGP